MNAEFVYIPDPKGHKMIKVSSIVLVEEITNPQSVRVILQEVQNGQVITVVFDKLTMKKWVLFLKDSSNNKWSEFI
jgi:hypothetical protein